MALKVLTTQSCSRAQAIVLKALTIKIANCKEGAYRLYTTHPTICDHGYWLCGSNNLPDKTSYKNPEASWDKKHNPHPWLNIKQNEQVKLFSHTDYSTFGANAKPELVPLFVIIGTGTVGAIAFTIRQAMKNPEASWDKKNNPHPWLNVRHDEQLKLYSHSDYAKLENARPESKTL
ncbi:NADH dehydrogenase 1 alpha subcomplex subunit 4 ndufa4 [Desmophyllum pertusum]|uniref:NADH dehydrogenase 1 alpha subcomplex subunit 4 ndufa4 n=1 Tax=Desmophyllum pertusum TaxID=174260 RepID=A0A9X0CNZ4_9CNID|nr:NADH dehydrogenase 1 alpha subcomplex subunit 4 ndufa4 [Desmophyllum pertusum]